MKVSIFAEESGTVRDDDDIPFREYYQGAFLTISGLADQLETYGDVDLHILSDQFGLVRGDELVKDSSEEGENESVDEEEELLKSARSSDVVVILLSTSKFDSLIVDNWPEMAESAKPDSIWALGAARSSLAAIDLELLRQKGCEVVTYERVGVARIDNETRDELLETIEMKHSK